MWYDIYNFIWKYENENTENLTMKTQIFIPNFILNQIFLNKR